MNPNFPVIRAFSVTTTAQVILKADKRRKAVLIYNNGTATVYLLSNRNQVANDGIPISTGANYSSDHFNAQGEYWIIGTGTDDVRVEEDLQGEN